MEDEKTFKIMDASELKKKLDSGDDFVLVDVLGEESYKERHLPKAVSIPITGDDFEESAKAKLPDKEKPVIVYCASPECSASPSAAKKLVELGYTDVTDFESGLKGWEEAGYSFEQE